MNDDSTTIRILLVDDDATIVNMFDMLLTLEGFEVRTLTDPEHALGVVADWQPHVVVLDIMMPGLDGREVARQIRDLAGTDGTGIVFHSALASDDDTWQAWQAGADSYITKPADPDQVIREVLRVLNDRRARHIDISQAIPAGDDVNGDTLQQR